MVSGDLRERASIDRALSGCDAVVHLAHSDDSAAPREAHHLVDACLDARVERLVHVSSMSVYGPHPGPECAHEATATIRRYYGESYSDSKAEVERVIRRAINRRGLRAVILRPTIVYGPYSPFVLAIIGEARSGCVTVLDGGDGICNAVFVDDVCDAIHAALRTDSAAGAAVIVNGNDDLTWKDFILAFGRLVDPGIQAVSLPSEEARRQLIRRRNSGWSNATALLRLMASPQFHSVLGTVPVADRLVKSVKRLASTRLSAEFKLTLKRRLRQPRWPQVSSPSTPSVSEGRLIRELCGVHFENRAAREALDWTPLHSFSHGVEVTKAWLSFARHIPG
jgi:nucleoside-diphosphate-sugar epimerase